MGGWGLGVGVGPHLQLSAPRTPLCICSQVSLGCGIHLSGGTFPMQVGQGYIFPGPSDTCWASEGIPLEDHSQNSRISLQALLSLFLAT